ncbi:MAG: hypothetical protein HOJ89_04270, partial [Opitutales bacterium]|nr:hypothetical protein [Opitutales bacterium]
MNKSKYFLSNLTLCVLVSILTFLSPQIAEGQTEIDLKIRLMSEALQARDSGDLTTARDRLQQLLEIAPADRSVQSILDSVDSMIDNKTRSGVAGNGAARRSALQSEAEYLARLEAERIEKSMVSSREIREIALRQAKRRDFP